MSDERDRARKLIALAVGSPYSEESRTAALVAAQLIDKHELLEADPALAGELGDLRAEVARLRATRSEDASQAIVLASSTAEIEELRREVARLRALPPATVHVVREGESPMGIARTYVGDPARAGELLAANPSKPRRLTPHGWTFAGLRVGERLRLPSGWI